MKTLLAQKVFGLGVSTGLFFLGLIELTAATPDMAAIIKQDNEAVGQYFLNSRQNPSTGGAEIYRNLAQTKEKLPGCELRVVCLYAAYLAALPKASDAEEVLKKIRTWDVKSHAEVIHQLEMLETVAQQAGDYEDSINNKQDSLRGMVHTWADFGEYARARKLAMTIKDDYTRSGALEELAWAQIEAGDLTGAEDSLTAAEQEARKIPDPYWQGNTLASLAGKWAHVAEVQFEAGNKTEAKKTLALALKKAMQVEDNPTENYNRSCALQWVVEVQAKSGDLVGALKTDDLISAGSPKLDTAQTLGDLLAKTGDKEGVRHLVAGLKKSADASDQSGWKAEVLTAASELQIKAGDRTEALETLAALEKTLEAAGFKAPSSYRDIGIWQARAGDTIAARKTAKLISDDAMKTSVVEEVRAVEERLSKGQVAYDWKENEGNSNNTRERKTDFELFWVTELGGNKMMELEWRPRSHLDKMPMVDPAELAKQMKQSNAGQRLADVERLLLVPMRFQMEIDKTLRDQFGS